MCTELSIVLPTGADISFVDGLTEQHKVGRGLAEGFPTEIPGEVEFPVSPWVMCHCGWSPKDLRAVVRDALKAGASPWIGVRASEVGALDPDGPNRVLVRPDEFATGEYDDQEVLYIVEPDRTPRPIVRRHGPRRRRSKT